MLQGRAFNKLLISASLTLDIGSSADAIISTLCLCDGELQHKKYCSLIDYNRTVATEIALPVSEDYDAQGLPLCASCFLLQVLSACTNQHEVLIAKGRPTPFTSPSIRYSPSSSLIHCIPLHLFSYHSVY
jgi:hypothetical protein